VIAICLQFVDPKKVLGRCCWQSALYIILVAAALKHLERLSYSVAPDFGSLESLVTSRAVEHHLLAQRILRPPGNIVRFQLCHGTSGHRVSRHGMISTMAGLSGMQGLHSAGNYLPFSSRILQATFPVCLHGNMLLVRLDAAFTLA
jgi:hypothetical protein